MVRPKAAAPEVLDPSRWPANTRETWPIGKLLPYAKNARTHPRAQVEQIANAIKTWGWTTPILVDEEGHIIAGHGRVLAAKNLGLAEVPVMIAKDWSDTDKRAYLIADNKISLNAGWDDEILGGELGDLLNLGVDLGSLGFDDDDEVGRLTGPAGTFGLTDPDDVPAVPEVPVSRLGDVWVLGRHRLLCGDSTDGADVAQVLGDVKPHLMVTDPPYGVNYNPKWRNDLAIDWTAQGQKTTQRAKTKGGFLSAGKPLRSRSLGKVENDHNADWREVWALFPGAIAYVWHGGLHAAVVQESLASAGFNVRAQIIWVKQHFVFSRGDYHWQHEPCWYAVRGTGNWQGDRKQTTVWEIANASAFRGKKDDSVTGHGTQKPVECMKRPIENNSSPGQAVYEPFSGSGTTIIAAEMTGRACYAIELSPAYVDVAVKRWSEFTGEKAVLEQSGRGFEEVAAERVPEAA